MATIEYPATYAVPGSPDSIVEVLPRYDNFIGGRWVAPVKGQYKANLTPATGEAVHGGARVDAGGRRARARRRPRSTRGVGRGIDDRAVAGAEPHRGRDRGEPRCLAVAESWDNGKPVRETLAADIPLAADHFRYFASVIRGEEGTISEIDKNTVAYHFQEPLGVVGQIIPFNFPLLMAAWKLAPALAAGNCVGAQAGEPDAVVDPQARGADRRRSSRRA